MSDIKKQHQIIEDTRGFIASIEDIAYSLENLGIPAGTQLRFATKALRINLCELELLHSKTINDNYRKSCEASSNVLRAVIVGSKLGAKDE